MPKITRSQFVKICYQAIKKSRDNVVICNQLSGYKKLHKALRDEDYIDKVRDDLKKTKHNEYLLKHKLIEQYGAGKCQEMADYLAVEIGKKLDEHDIDAQIKIVSSVAVDHVYIDLGIFLFGEQYKSWWEIDAWDPRVIDISPRADGSIKNIEYLDYGYKVDVLNSFRVKDLKEYPSSFFAVKKAAEGAPSRSPTPEREILLKHKYVYSDLTIDEARKKRKICDDTDHALGYLQKASTWQK